MTETDAKKLLMLLQETLSGCDDFLTRYRLNRIILDLAARLNP